MSKIRVGIFGLDRGANFLPATVRHGGEVVAICDKNPDFRNWAARYCREELGCEVTAYEDFDKFIEHDMDAVFLANCFHEHAPAAIAALERGLHVVTECQSNVTMAQGVALVRAQEKSGKVFMLAENYPFMLFNQEMRRIFRSGSLGDLAYAEGEYNHPINWDDLHTLRHYRPYAKHWRNFLPVTFYSSHSLAPLMYITGARPKRVSAFPIMKSVDEFENDPSYVFERTANITTANDDGSVFRFTGWAQYGAHHNSYRICGTKGQVENLRDHSDRLLLRYNDWQIPEGEEELSYRELTWPEDIREQVEAFGHDGGDYFIMKVFLEAIKEGRQPEFDVHFATTCASVAILGHRSILENGKPFHIPDFRREEDRIKYENDDLNPFWGTNGTPPTLPCTCVPDYAPDSAKLSKFMELVDGKEQL